MIVSILASLWNGDASFSHNAQLYSEACRQALHRVVEEETRLRAHLNAQGLECLAAYQNAENEFACLQEQEAFVYGFRLGVQLLLDAMGKA